MWFKLFKHTNFPWSHGPSHSFSIWRWVDLHFQSCGSPGDPFCCINKGIYGNLWTMCQLLEPVVWVPVPMLPCASLYKLHLLCVCACVYVWVHSCMCVHITVEESSASFVCVCIWCMYECDCTSCTHMEARGWHQGASSVAFQLMFSLRQSFTGTDRLS